MCQTVFGMISPSALIVVCLWPPKGANAELGSLSITSIGKGRAKPCSISSEITGSIKVENLGRDR
jgi:hypothetical protein